MGERLAASNNPDAILRDPIEQEVAPLELRFDPVFVLLELSQSAVTAVSAARRGVGAVPGWPRS